MSQLQSRDGKHALAGRNSFSISADMSGLDAYLDQLGDAIDEAARPAAQAGSQVLYEQVKSNVRGMGRKSGNLERSIYQVHSKADSVDGGAQVYHVSWNHIKAPHGHLLENGWLQRYEVVRGKGGALVTAVRPEMQGKPKPKRSAGQAARDAYYVPRVGGPKQQPARAFVRSAQAAFPRAMEAAKAELFRQIPT